MLTRSATSTFPLSPRMRCLAPVLIERAGERYGLSLTPDEVVAVQREVMIGTQAVEDQLDTTLWSIAAHRYGEGARVTRRQG